MRVLDDGTVVTVPVPDNQVRQRAVESVFDVVGAKQNTRGESDNSGPKLTLVLPNYYSPEFLERERKVIDVTGTVEPSSPDAGGHSDGIQLIEDDVSDRESLSLHDVVVEYGAQPTDENTSPPLESGADGMPSGTPPDESVHSDTGSDH